MQKSLWIFFLVFILLSACNSSSKNEKNDLSNTASGTLSQLKVTHEVLPQKLPEAFRETNEINAWQNFKDFEQSVEGLAGLNTSELSVFLKELDSTLLVLAKGDIPKIFDQPQINSRIKVVRTQLLKAKYFTEHPQEDSLSTTLNKLFQSYNAFLDRMVSIVQEEPFSSESDESTEEIGILE